MRALLTTLLLGACTGDPVLLADLPDGTHEGARCTDEDDCTLDRFCERVACGDVAGTCRSFPEHCDAGPAPVCGCDGKPYENGCARRAAGVTADTPGKCSPK